MKVCIPSSSGGHLTEARLLAPAYSQYPHFYVLNHRIPLSPDMKDRTYFIDHAERDWRQLINIIQAWRILRAERPDVILSTGASPALIFAIVGKLFGCKVIFVETITRVDRPSLTARLIYHLADRFYYQWPGLQRYFPSGINAGKVL